MSLLSHSFSNPLPVCSPSSRLCLHYASFKERQLVLCDNDDRPTNSKARRLFNSNEYSKEEIDHVWQQRCNCEGTHVILFVFPGLIVICLYGRTNTYYSTELAVIKAQEFNSMPMDSKRLQNYIFIWIVRQFACLELALSWS